MTISAIERIRFEEWQQAAMDDKLSWLDDGAEARRKFQQLAMDTYDALRPLGADFV